MLLVICQCCCRELESVAAESGRMSAGSNGRTQVPSAAHMRLQFNDMLELQGAAETLEMERRKHKHTMSLLHEEHKKVQAANAEVTLANFWYLAGICAQCLILHTTHKLLTTQTWYGYLLI